MAEFAGATSQERVAKRSFTPCTANDGSQTTVQGPTKDGQYFAKDPGGTARPLDSGNPKDKSLIDAKDAKNSGKSQPTPETTPKEETPPQATPPAKDQPANKKDPAPKKEEKKKPRDLSLPFMLEIWLPKDSKPKWSFIFPYNPDSYQASLGTRVNLMLTQGGTFEDNLGLAPRRISLQGTFGYLASLQFEDDKKNKITGHGKYLKDGKRNDGWGTFKDLEKNFIDFYTQYGYYKENGEVNQGFTDWENLPEIRFYNFTDQDYFVVSIQRFELLRSVQHRNMYRYVLDFLVQRRLDEKQAKNIEKNLDKVQQEKASVRAPKTPDLTEKFVKGLGTATQAMNDLTRKIGEFSSKIKQIQTAIAGFTGGLTNLVQAPFGVVKDSIGLLSTIKSSLATTANLPFEVIRELRSIERDLNLLIQAPSLFSSSSVSVGYVSTYEPGKPEILTVPVSPSMSAQFTSMSIPERTLFSAGSTDMVSASQKTVTVLSTDTIRSLAEKSGSSWGDIVTLNNLEYPFISSLEGSLEGLRGTVILQFEVTPDSVLLTVTGASVYVGDYLFFEQEVIQVYSVSGDQLTLVSGVKYSYQSGYEIKVYSDRLKVAVPGTKILIPSNTTSVIPGVDSKESIYTQLFFKDDAVDSTGGMLAEGSPLQHSGLTNLEQQFRTRLMTLRGELSALGHPKYGSLIPTYVGDISNAITQEKILLEAKVAILDDERVSSISSISGSFQEDGAFLDILVVLKDQTDPIRLGIPL